MKGLLLISLLLLGAILATKSEINEDIRPLIVNDIENREENIDNKIEELEVQNIAESKKIKDKNKNKNGNKNKNKNGNKNKNVKKRTFKRKQAKKNKGKRPKHIRKKPRKGIKRGKLRKQTQNETKKKKKKKQKQKKKKTKKVKKGRKKNGKRKRKKDKMGKKRKEQQNVSNKKKRRKQQNITKKKIRKQIRKKKKQNKKKKKKKNDGEKTKKKVKEKRKQKNENGNQAKKEKTKKKFRNKNGQPGKSFGVKATIPSCDEIILSRIKLERKAVNYMRQFNRSTRFMGKTENKLKKKDIWQKSTLKDPQDPISLLIKCGGGDENNLKCAGSTSNKNSVTMMTLLSNLKNCTPNIGSDCKEDKFPAKDAAFDGCAKSLMGFQAMSQECLKKDGAGACDCYKKEDAVTLYDAGKACDAPKMQQYERSVLKTKDNCVTKFKDCRKYQDELASVMMLCCGEGGECKAS